jgi:hypothetical protein
MPLGVKKVKTEFGAQNQYVRVIYQSIKNFKRKKVLRVQKRKLGPKKSKVIFHAKKIKTSRHFKKCTLKKFCRTQRKKKNKLAILECMLFLSHICSKKKHTFGGQKAKIRLQSLKTEFKGQNQYGLVIYPSFGNFKWSKKDHAFGGQKG